MKKLLTTLGIICFATTISYSQLMVSKLIGKDAQNSGTGFGLFAFLDFPLAAGNQSIRVELLDITYYPSKGQGFFTGTDGKGYLSAKLGYKYVFSETQSGFYLLPSVGWGDVIVVTAEQEKAQEHHGIGAAMEAGYSLALGESNNSVNLGLKYDYGTGSKGVSLQSLSLRLSFSFGFFGRRE